MTDAKIYLRKNGSFGASCGGIADTGHTIHEDSGRFTVYDLEDPDTRIIENATRAEAEAAIAENWWNLPF